MKNTILILFIILLGVYSPSCDKIGKCGSNVKLGTIHLSEVSKAFIPYNGNEELIFLNNENEEYRLKSIEGIKNSNFTTIVKDLCTNNIFDFQYEYYDSNKVNIDFYDSDENRTISISLTVIGLTDEETDITSLFELLSVKIGQSFKSNPEIIPFAGDLKIITNEIQNPPSQDLLNVFAINTRYIGDTILANHYFHNVYTAKAYDHLNKIYYNKEKGLIGMGNIDEFWVLSY